jgi:hypothetical protein
MSPTTELLAKHPVRLAKVINDLHLALIHAPLNGDQQKSEWVENSLGLQRPLSRVWDYGGTTADSCRSSFRTIRGNFSKRVLKPIAKSAGIDDFDFRAMRSTASTLFQTHGTVKDTQGQMRTPTRRPPSATT